MNAGAILSADRIYRYSLWRRMQINNLSVMTVIGFNPSTADERKDDPTIRRCKSFALREGCGRLEMVNLYALRSTDPKDVVRAGARAIGPDNDDAIYDAMIKAHVVVAAWGALPADPKRVEAVTKMAKTVGCGLMCFGRTASGAPRHPLYIRNDTPLERWL